MKRCGKIAICLAGALALNASLRADDVALADNPYATIVARNIFNLNPPPPPVDPNATAPVEPAVKITPNGIMSVFGQLQVLFKASGGGKPGDQSYILGEGQMDDEIEVVKIDEKNSLVTFKNHGLLQTLPLANVTSIAAPAAPAAGFSPLPGFPAVVPGGGGNNGGILLPAMGVRGGNNAAGQNGANISTPQAVATRAVPAPKPQETVDPDVQKVLIVAQHLKAEMDGDPIAKIFPPTELDEAAGVTSNLKSPPPPPLPPMP